MDVTLGVESGIVYDVADVIHGRVRARRALVPIDSVEGLFLLPSCHGYETKVITGQAIRQVVESLSESFDYILLDSPAGIEAGFRRSVAAADEAIVVATPHITSLRDADKVLGMLAGYGLERTGLIVNRVRGDLMLRGENLDLQQISDLLCCGIIGAVPECDEVSDSLTQARFVGADSPAGQSYALIAEYLEEKANAYSTPRRVIAAYGDVFGAV